MITRLSMLSGFLFLFFTILSFNLSNAQYKWIETSEKFIFVCSIDTFDTYPGDPSIFWYGSNLMIEVFEKESGKLIQVMDSLETTPLSKISGGDPFRSKDLNFDGVEDIYITTRHYVNGGRKAYDFYLFNPAKGLFEAAVDAKQIDEFDLIPKRKQIHTRSRAGADFGIHSLYEWQGNKLVMIANEWADGETGVVVCEKLINGVMTEVKDPLSGAGPDIYDNNCRWLK